MNTYDLLARLTLAAPAYFTRWQQVFLLYLDGEWLPLNVQPYRNPVLKGKDQALLEHALMAMIQQKPGLTLSQFLERGERSYWGVRIMTETGTVYLAEAIDLCDALLQVYLCYVEGDGGEAGDAASLDTLITVD